jgi:hypothetical protein
VPSAFDQIFAGGREVLLQQHGVAVVWTKADGSVVATTGISGGDTQVSADSEAGEVLRRVRSLELQTADVPDPNRGDACTIDGDPTAWSFEAVDWRQGGFVGVRVTRPEAAELTQRGYRNRV